MWGVQILKQRSHPFEGVCSSLGVRISLCFLRCDHLGLSYGTLHIGDLKNGRCRFGFPSYTNQTGSNILSNTLMLCTCSGQARHVSQFSPSRRVLFSMFFLPGVTVTSILPAGVPVDLASLPFNLKFRPIFLVAGIGTLSEPV